MTIEEREKEIRKQPIPTKEECLAFYKELTKLADIRFVPYYKMAIKALEQQTCKDCISRDAVLRLVEQYPNIIGNRCVGLMADINHLPPVTPSIPDVENDFNLGYNCGYADAMIDIAESEDKE